MIYFFVFIFTFLTTGTLWAGIKDQPKPKRIESLCSPDSQLCRHYHVSVDSVLYKLQNLILKKSAPEKIRLEKRMPVRMPYGYTGLLFDLDHYENMYVVVNYMFKPLCFILSMIPDGKAPERAYVPDKQNAKKSAIFKNLDLIFSVGPISDGGSIINGGMFIGTYQF